MSDRDKILQLLDALKREHYVCQDFYFSCAKVEEGSKDRPVMRIDGSIDEVKCSCGADEANEKIETIRRLVLALGNVGVSAG